MLNLYLQFSAHQRHRLNLLIINPFRKRTPIKTGLLVVHLCTHDQAEVLTDAPRCRRRTNAQHDLRQAAVQANRRRQQVRSLAPFQLSGQLDRVLEQRVPDALPLVAGQRAEEHHLEQALDAVQGEQIDGAVNGDHEVHEGAAVGTVTAGALKVVEVVEFVRGGEHLCRCSGEFE